MSSNRPLSLDGLLCALVIAPQVYARNRFFELFEQPALRRVRRRATLLRGVIRQLTNTRGHRGEVVGILSERDIIRAVTDYKAAALTMQVRNFMSSPVKTCRRSGVIGFRSSVKSSR